MEPPPPPAAAAAGARTEAAGAARPINASAPDRSTFRIEPPDRGLTRATSQTHGPAATAAGNRCGRTAQSAVARRGPTHPRTVWVTAEGQGSRGRPRTFSATMLRWTSAVPPPTVSAGEKRKPRDQVGSRRRRRRAPAADRSRPACRGARPGPGPVHDVLAVGVGDGLADRGLGARAPAPPGRPRPSAGAAPAGSGPPSRRRPAGPGSRGRRPPAPAAPAPDQIHQILGRRAHPPQRPLARERHTLVAERDLGQLPSAVLGPDEMVGRDPHVGQEHLVEGVLARHVDERPDVDPRRIHGADEVADPHVLGGRRIGAGEQDPPLGDVRVARPHLLPVDDPVVAVALGPGGERRPGPSRRRARRTAGTRSPPR